MCASFVGEVTFALVPFVAAISLAGMLSVEQCGGSDLRQGYELVCWYGDGQWVDMRSKVLN
jgi:hypothetical protein